MEKNRRAYHAFMGSADEAEQGLGGIDSAPTQPLTEDPAHVNNEDDGALQKSDTAGKLPMLPEFARIERTKQPVLSKTSRTGARR